MIANNEQFNRLVEIISNRTPITEDLLRRLFPVGEIVIPEEMIMAAAMKRIGVSDWQVITIMNEYHVIKGDLLSEVACSKT
jgi:hypothetical protein